jgi:hypothetical protein
LPDCFWYIIPKQEKIPNNRKMYQNGHKLDNMAIR